MTFYRDTAGRIAPLVTFPKEMSETACAKAIIAANDAARAEGNRFVTDGGHNGSPRVIGTDGFESLLQNGRFGKEGTTLWFSFLFRAVSTSADNAAGVLFYDGAVSAANQVLYIGVPTGGTALGIFASGGGALSSVAGTNPQTLPPPPARPARTPRRSRRRDCAPSRRHPLRSRRASRRAGSRRPAPALGPRAGARRSPPSAAAPPRE